LAFHVFASVLGCALLAVACAAGLLFVWRRKSLKAGGPGGMDGGWPALTALDGLFVRATGWGMIFLTAGMVLGAFRIPGTEGHDAWYADVRTVLSLLGWGLFAVTAIARRRRGFSTPAAVGLGVAGYLLILAGLLARGLGASGFHKF
ncbi:MAG: cytochrome c biogenesis protein CcsA, partial [Planctomycetota bacterium]